MTRERILAELRAGLLAVGFVAVDDLSQDTEGEIFLRVHSGEAETDDTPLTHVNFAREEIAGPAVDTDAAHRRMIDTRIAVALRSCRERVGDICRAEAEKQIELDRVAAVEALKVHHAACQEVFRAEQEAQQASREHWAGEMERAAMSEPVAGAAVWDSAVWGA